MYSSLFQLSIVIRCLYLMNNSIIVASEVTSSKLIDDKDNANLKNYKEKCDGLIKMISRDRMKVVFFGR